MSVKHISDEDFDAVVLKSTKPVMVDFYADWCGPCKMAAPILDQLTKEQSDVEIVGLDVDANPEAASKYGVMSIPTVIVFKNGQEVDRQTGFSGKQMYTNLIDKVK